jgi:ribosome-associated protein
MAVEVSEDLRIPEEEFTFTTSRSSGPGGQNVNKVSTRVTLLFDLERSPSLSLEQRDLIRRRLAGRVNQAGVLRVVSQRHRTQSANRETAVRRFGELLAEALTESPERVPVAVPGSVKQRRLDEKRQRGRLKKERAFDVTGDD